MIYELSNEVTTRSNFHKLLVRYSLINTFVEVGVHRGAFLQSILAAVKITNYVGIDIWKAYDASDPASYGDRDADYLRASALAKAHKATLRKQDSIEASKQFEDNSIDCVYIDACHQYEAVLNDIRAWYPKIKPNGILAGHDVLCPGEVAGGWGRMVQQALNEFFPKDKLLYLVPDAYSAWSYYTWKE